MTDALTYLYTIVIYYMTASRFIVEDDSASSEVREKLKLTIKINLVFFITSFSLLFLTMEICESLVEWVRYGGK